MTPAADRRPIWYFADLKIWWMEPPDHLKALRLLNRCHDGIHVRNAYEVLDPRLIADLREEADQL